MDRNEIRPGETMQEYAHRVTRLAVISKSGKPYQSVYILGEMLVEGERADQPERHALILDEDLHGRRVLDVGCNIGTSAFLAYESGAAAVNGWDSNRAWVEVARDLAYGFGYNHAVNFSVVELPDVSQYEHESWHTGFFFSIARHVDVRPAMALCEVCYVETNVRDNRRLRTDITKGWQVELIGRLTRRRCDMYRLMR